MNLNDFHFEAEAQRANAALVSRSSEGQTIRWEHELNGFTVTSNLWFEDFNSSLGDEFVFMGSGRNAQ